MRDSEGDAFDMEWERMASKMGFGGGMGRLGYAGNDPMPSRGYMRSYTDNN